MSFRNRPANLNPVTTIGLVFLIVANVSSYLMKRNATLPESVVDGTTGFLFGVAIALLLVGIWRSARQIREKRAATSCPGALRRGDS